MSWTRAGVLCLQSFDLQRVLEGEKALRSEATRQLKEVEKKLVSLRSPAVALSSPMPAPPGSERTLEADKAMLQDQIKAHSAQVCFKQPNNRVVAAHVCSGCVWFRSQALRSIHQDTHLLDMHLLHGTTGSRKTNDCYYLAL